MSLLASSAAPLRQRFLAKSDWRLTAQGAVMAKNPRPSAKTSPKAPPADGDGNHIYNEILLALGQDCQALLSKLELVRLKVRTVLHEPGDSLKIRLFL